MDRPLIYKVHVPSFSGVCPGTLLPMRTTGMHNGGLYMHASRGQTALRLHSALSSQRYSRQCCPASATTTLRVPLITRPQNFSTRYQARNASIKAKAKTKTLAQGLIEPDASLAPLPTLGLEPMYPTVIQQARDNMRLFSSCVLLTRVGGFYELYCEHATKYGPLLGLKVGAKSTAGAGKVPMAGFPWMHLDRYLGMLVRDHGLYVAISEEVKIEGEGIDGEKGIVNERVKKMEGRVRSGGNLWDRRVVRVVTRGMLVGEGWLEGGQNNWCLGVWVDEGKAGKAARRDTNDEQQDAEDRVQPEDEMEQVLETGGIIAADKLRLANAAVGMAWVDLSTGEFYTQSSIVSELPSLVTRIGPKEIVLTNGMSRTLKGLLLDMLGPEQLLISWQNEDSAQEDIEAWNPMLDSPISGQTRAALTTEETAAGSVLMNYVRGHLMTSETKLRSPVVRRDTDNMIIDKHTMRGLEILETIRDSRAKGSLLHAVSRTVTNSGARLLRDRITRPSTILSVINDRLDLVQELLEDEQLRKELRSLLTETFDTQRLIQKFALARADADDLVSLSRTIQTTDKIAASLSESETNNALSSLRQRFTLEEASALSSRIANAIDEDGLLAAHEQEQEDSADVISTAQQVLAGGDLQDIQALGSVVRAKAKSLPQHDKEEDTWIMRRTASQRLTNLHDMLYVLTEQKDDLCDQLRTRSQLKGLSLQWQPSMGYICHLKGKGARSIQTFTDAFPEATVVRGLKTTSSFYIPAWTVLGKQIDHTKAAIREEEQVVFRDLRDDVVRNLLRLRRNAAILDELDVACSSATLAQEQHAIRPIVDSSTALEIVAGRHPTVTLGLEEKGRQFVSNDCFLNTQSSPTPQSSPPHSSTPARSTGERLHLLTGPNMAGKSTFLRQNALLTLLAQTGLFVPAAYARIGIVDALFARIGSADNLFSDQSTFMTEMLETAHILTHATSRSLVIMDEVGRGTTPQDGEAVAFASLRHLVEVNGCRGLFATHFHGVVGRAERAGWAGPAGGSGAVGMYCTDIKEVDVNGEESAGFVFVHKVRKGVNRKSHALRIAAMAGLPARAVEAAREALRAGG